LPPSPANASARPPQPRPPQPRPERRRSRTGWTAALAFLAAHAPGLALAEAPRLALPVQCEIGRECWVVNYMDHDPGEGRRDYRCGRLTYDGHSGTDIAVRTLKDMEKGVPVLAAAAGRVRGVRDGVRDVNVNEGGRDAIKGKECGNGVAIEHGDGWETQYCHMKRGSIRVKAGGRVEAGQPLGMIGLSGLTEFPHVHLSVRHNGKNVDPFVGIDGAPRCGPGNRALWRPDAVARLAYATGTVYLHGVAGDRPQPSAARAGELGATTLPADSPALILWADVFGVKPGDTLTLTVRDPAGKVLVDHTRTMEREQIRVFSFAGKKRPGAGWPPGAYEGRIAYKRKDGGGDPEPVAVRFTVE